MPRLANFWEYLRAAWMYGSGQVSGRLGVVIFVIVIPIVTALSVHAGNVLLMLVAVPITVIATYGVWRDAVVRGNALEAERDTASNGRLLAERRLEQNQNLLNAHNEESRALHERLARVEKEAARLRAHMGAVAELTLCHVCKQLVPSWLIERAAPMLETPAEFAESMQRENDIDPGVAQWMAANLTPPKPTAFTCRVCLGTASAYPKGETQEEYEARYGPRRIRDGA